MDLQVAASGGGYGHTECPQGIPVEFALLSILAAFGVAFGVLFMALTQQTMGRRRRSTDGDGDDKEGVVGDLAFKFGDILWAGEFWTPELVLGLAPHFSGHYGTGTLKKWNLKSIYASVPVP